MVKGGFMNALSPISIYALGGLCEVGKNTYCFESDTGLIIVDAGVLFPEAGLPGVNYVIPDYTKLRNSRQKVRALFITHGHEDHIGGIPFLIQNLYIPIIYASKLAAAMIRNKLEDMHIKESTRIVEIDSNSVINVDQFKVTFFRVTHSIPDSFGVCIDTPQGRIVHTGDFKIDLTPVGQEMEINKISRLGDEGVDLLLSDSTNAEIEGYTPSEKSVVRAIRELFDETQGRFILSTFSSNLSRIQQVAEVANENNRKIVIVGRSMESAVSIARDYGYLKIPDSAIIDVSEINKYKPVELCILCTGSQGEPMAALSKIANGEHKSISIIPGDTVILSSSAIPGNGVMIEKLVNLLVRRGADVITNSIYFSVHASGHPSKQELRLMLKLTRPKYFMPIHGEYRMLKEHGRIAESLGMAKENIFIMDNGDSLVLFNHKISAGPHYQADAIYIDGNDINGIGSPVIKDRAILKDDGLIAVFVGIDSRTNKIIVPLEIKTKGYIYQSNKDLEQIKYIANKALLESLSKPNVTFADIKKTIKLNVSHFVIKKTERNPMIIPVIMDQNYVDISK